MLEHRVEETEASYPDTWSGRDSRDGSPNELEEVVNGVSDGCLKLQVRAPPPKHWGHVVGHLWWTTSVMGPI